ncbi:MAG: hypothetical protein Q8M29_05360 [Bacteroidota bacterium]|nr:hypothetical protein [Bacteroidota bacterium]
MKKVLVIFLLLQVITNNTFAEELVKMPRLFTHYYHHAREHKDTKDFFDFLHKHYSDHHQNDNHSKNHSEEDTDCALPFKHCGGCCVGTHAPVVGFVPSFQIADYTCFQVKDLGFPAENDRIESTDGRTIWQPPKLA